VLEVDVSRTLDGFSLTAEFSAGGGITALFGRSGVGKTMLVNMLAGLHRPNHGRIALNGQVLFDSTAGIDVPPDRRRLGYVFQEDRLFPHMTVRSNLTYGMKLVPPDERRIDFDSVVHLLDIAGLLDRRPHNLSGGEKQRVSIGRALLASPRLVLMDEPLASLDAARRAEILPFIEDLRDELDLPVVYVSHSMDEIVRLADTVVLMTRGTVAASGPVEDLLSRLDLRPLTGRYDAGAVLSAVVEGHDDADGLTRLAVPGGTLLVAALKLDIGTALRVRIRARDVTLSLNAQKDVSVLNQFRGVVAQIAEDEGPHVDVLVDIGTPLWARITRRSASALGLEPGKVVHALVKSVAIDRFSLGLRGRQPR
jgi:molybdate transport system ATP-binding protein